MCPYGWVRSHVSLCALVWAHITCVHTSVYARISVGNLRVYKAFIIEFVGKMVQKLHFFPIFYQFLRSFVQLT
jgi:hypothetical protein